MKLKFFADHCISNFIIQALRGAGCEVIRLKDGISPDIESELGNKSWSVTFDTTARCIKENNYDIC